MQSMEAAKAHHTRNMVAKDNFFNMENPSLIKNITYYNALSKDFQDVKTEVTKMEKNLMIPALTA